MSYERTMQIMAAVTGAAALLTLIVRWLGQAEREAAEWWNSPANRRAG